MLLALNLFFIANLLSWEALLLYALLSLGVYRAGLLLSRGAARGELVFYGSIGLLIAFFLLIRAPFLQTSFDERLASESGLLGNVGFVYGYSYFMFKAINFLIASRLQTLQSYSLANYLNFMFFFSSFTAGPIGRYADFQDADFTRSVPIEERVDGIQRILTGLIKKYVIGDFIAQFSLLAFDSPMQIRSVPAGWAATWAYMLYIYVDFSAYSDIAIGLGKLFGYRLPENFDWPLLKPNLVRFWESWHMSLTTWIRDHVFTPLRWRLLELRDFSDGPIVLLSCYLSTMIVFALWHQLTLPFLVFGIVQGAGLALTQSLIGLRRRHLSQGANDWIERHLLPRAIGAVGVNVFVALTLVLFRFDLGDSLVLLRYLFTGNLS